MSIVWNRRFAATLATLAAGALLLSTQAHAQAGMSFTGTSGSGNVSGSNGLSGSTLSFGTALALPTNINFGDILGGNSGTGPLTYTDSWTFSFAQAAGGGGSVTGEALWLRNFTLTGIIDAVSVVDTTTGTTLYSNTLSGATATSFLVGSVTPGDQYTLTIGSTVPAGATVASYTGLLVMQAVPEPESWVLMGAGLVALVLTVRARRR